MRLHLAEPVLARLGISSCLCYVVPGSCPLLLGRGILRSAKLVVDLATEEVFSATTGAAFRIPNLSLILSTWQITATTPKDVKKNPKPKTVQEYEIHALNLFPARRLCALRRSKFHSDATSAH